MDLAINSGKNSDVNVFKAIHKLSQKLEPTQSIQWKPIGYLFAISKDYLFYRKYESRALYVYDINNGSCVYYRYFDLWVNSGKISPDGKHVFIITQSIFQRAMDPADIKTEIYVLDLETMNLHKLYEEAAAPF